MKILVDLDNGKHLYSSFLSTAWSKKNQAKFSDTCSVRADGLRVGSPWQVGERKAGNSNMEEFFCTTLYTMLVSNPAWPPCVVPQRRPYFMPT